MTDPHDPAMPALPRSTDRTAGLDQLPNHQEAVERVQHGATCPTCHAAAGDPCTGPRDGGGTEPLADVHLKRWELYEAARRRREAHQGDGFARFGPVTSGEPLTFDGRCRYCGEPFQYQAPGIVLGEDRRAPLTGPRHVCERPQCQEREAHAVADREAAERAEADQELSRRRREAFLKWVPDLYHVKARPGHAAHTSHIVPELRDWTHDQSLYLHGPAGSGKTHQVACLMLKVAGRHGFEWYSTRRLIADAQASITSKRIERPAVFGAPCASPVLVLNDLFAERSTEYAVSEVGNLIDARYEAGLPVIVTSNLSLAEAAAKYDPRRSDTPAVAQELERITTRLLEMTAPPRGIRHRLDDVDWRTAIAMQAMEQAANEGTTR